MLMKPNLISGRNKIAKMMSDETWLNAKKAHEMGFVDGILFAEKKMPVVPEKEEEPDEEHSITIPP